MRFAPLPFVAALVIVLSSRSLRAQGSAQPDPWDDCYRKHEYHWKLCRAEYEARVFRSNPGLAHRTPQGLVLQLTNGDSAVIRDTTTRGDGPGSRLYWLQAFNKAADYFVVGMNGYEDRGSTVVSRKTGHQTHVPFGLPVFSSDGRFMAATIPLATAYWQPAIDIYVVSDSGLVREFSMESQVGFSLHMGGDTLWGPTAPDWVGIELRFRTEQTGEAERRRCPRGDYKCEYWPGDSMAIAKRNGRWEIRRLK